MTQHDHDPQSTCTGSCPNRQANIARSRSMRCGHCSRINCPDITHRPEDLDVTDDTSPAEAPATDFLPDAVKRKVLDFVEARGDVALDSVIVASRYEREWLTEYDGGGGYFAIDVYWQEPEPRPDYEREVPHWDGTYSRHRQLRNDEITPLLDLLVYGRS